MILECEQDGENIEIITRAHGNVQVVICVEGTVVMFIASPRNCLWIMCHVITYLLNATSSKPKIIVFLFTKLFSHLTHDRHSTEIFL